ncbi:MAG: hypothetical protein HQL06_06770 [Nitrospirae bacterium]|nr:hypothetical protein [Nitrospirota bacterium]
MTDDKEINAYDYWKVLVKRKKIIVFLFLISITFTLIIGFFQTGGYIGEVVLHIMPGCTTAKQMECTTVKQVPGCTIAKPLECTTAKQVKDIMHNLNKDRLKIILPKAYSSVYHIKLTYLQNEQDKLKVFILAKSQDVISVALSELVEYIANLSQIRDTLEQNKDNYLRRTNDISFMLGKSELMMKYYNGILQKDNKNNVVIAINPVELYAYVTKLKNEKFELEFTLKQLKGVGFFTTLNILKNHIEVKIIYIAGFISVFIGVLLAFLLESIEKNKSNS